MFRRRQPRPGEVPTATHRTAAGYEQDQGVWIFVSHSHNDIAKVRAIRNELERLGHNPLLFFLKCMDDDSDLDDLIRREIEARTWFLLCDSDNARSSRWVQAEVEIIKTLEGKVYETIDLESIDLAKPISEQLTQIHGIDALLRRATVFLSYAHVERAVVDRLRDELTAQEFLASKAEPVFTQDIDSIPVGSDYADVVVSAIDRTLATGSVVWILTSASLRASMLVEEMRLSLERANALGVRDRVIPVLLDDEAWSRLVVALPDAELLSSVRVHLEDSARFAQGVAELIRRLKRTST